MDSRNERTRRDLSFYIGLFITSFTILTLEITLTRLLSVLTWYHLVFFAVSTALLGMTVGSVTVYLYPDWFHSEKLPENLTKASLIGSLIIPFCLVMLLQIPVQMSVLSLVTITLFSTLPFYILGICISAVLTKTSLPIGKLYASDLAGAALGCLIVLIGLEILSAPNMILVCGASAALASISYGWTVKLPRLRVIGIWILTVTILLVLVSSIPSNRLHPVTTKGKFEDKNIYLERWNSYSRVTVGNAVEVEPHYWSPSPFRPKDFRTLQYLLKIDSDAGTTIRRFSSLEDIDHLRYEGTNLVHYLRPHGTACIIGFGGGKDILGAILFGHEKIIGIDVNRIFVDLLENEFREFAGIAKYPGVELIADEARSYLARNELDCTIIQMSLIDTWAATGAGAFSLSENGLYTTNAWEIFLNRLTEDGILTVSRWYNPENLGETGRLVSLAVATLQNSGVEDPSSHLAMISVNSVATILVSKRPFNSEDIQTIKKVSDDMQFDLVLVPGDLPQNDVLKGILSAQTKKQLSDFTRKQALNISPPTDDNPYFFNQLRLRNIYLAYVVTPGIIQGNLIATATLVGLIFSLAVMAVVTIVIPLWFKLHISGDGKSRDITRAFAGIYFSLIGAGFMLVEIALIQRFSVFLGHPVYSLSVLLFTIIASTGLGSYISERLPIDRKPWFLVLPILTAFLIISMRLMISVFLPALTTTSMSGKIIAAILLIGPLGFVMGFFFPMGMRLVRKINDEDSPWYWALNGIFGVLCSAVAVLLSIYMGISYNFYLAGLCYILLPIPLFFLHKSGQSSD